MRAVNRLFRRSRALAASCLVGPAVLWLLVVYVLSLVLLIFASLYTIDDFTFETTDVRTLDNLRRAFTQRDVLDVVLRSVLVAAGGDGRVPRDRLTDGVLHRQGRQVLGPTGADRVVPRCRCGPATWSRATPGRRCCGRAARARDGGFLQSVFGFTPGFGMVAVVMTLTYLWLPFMILPIYAGLERLPPSLLDAAGDLGAKPLRTFTSVIVPLLVPAIAAGSIFTFSLSLGDFIMPRLASEGKVTMIGNLIYSTFLAPNQPLAAAYTLWPLLIIVVYLLGMRRAGAFESLCDVSPVTPTAHSARSSS